MKYFMIAILLLMASCKSHKSIMALNGIYISSYEHEFGKTNDTLIVAKVTDAENLFKINRHSGINKKIQNKVFPKEVMNETWMLQFDPANQTLSELKTGKILVWDRRGLTLTLGNRKYKKIH